MSSTGTGPLSIERLRLHFCAHDHDSPSRTNPSSGPNFGTPPKTTCGSQLFPHGPWVHGGLHLLSTAGAAVPAPINCAVRTRSGRVAAAFWCHGAAAAAPLAQVGIGAARVPPARVRPAPVSLGAPRSDKQNGTSRAGARPIDDRKCRRMCRRRQRRGRGPAGRRSGTTYVHV